MTNQKQIFITNGMARSGKDTFAEYLNDFVPTLKYSSIDKEKRILLIDIREPKEIEKAKKAFGAKTILIKRNDVKSITSNMADAGVFDYDYDFVIENNGTLDDFYWAVYNFAKENILNDE